MNESAQLIAAALKAADAPAKYTVECGKSGSYLGENGFLVAESGCHPSDVATLKRLADSLNELESLRASHGELVEVLTQHHKDTLVSWAGYPHSPLETKTLRALSRAQSITNPEKTR